MDPRHIDLRRAVRPVTCMITDRRRFAGGEDALVQRVAAAAKAGVHLVQVRERDMEARDLARLVGRSVHTVTEAVTAHADGGVDYLLFGAVFATTSKPGQPPAGVQALADVV